MLNRRIVIGGIVIVLSGILGSLLSLFTRTGFFDKNIYSHIPLLIAAIFVWYGLLLCNFLLSFSNKHKKILMYALAAGIFTVSFYRGDILPIVTPIAGVLYFFFLIATERVAMERSNNYIKFNLSAIFLPIVNVGTVFLLITAILIGYLQGYKLTLSDPERIIYFLTRILTPVFAQISYLFPPEVSTRKVAELILKEYRAYLWLVPFMTALIVAVIVQPIIWISALFIRIINPLVLYMLKKLRVITVSTRMVEQEVVTID